MQPCIYTYRFDRNKYTRRVHRKNNRIPIHIIILKVCHSCDDNNYYPFIIAPYRVQARSPFSPPHLLSNKAFSYFEIFKYTNYI